MENNNPLVSIIVITYNSAKYVLETLESAKAQTYRNIELIVSDDSSTDNTVNICRNWLGKNNNHFIRTELITSEKNTGIAANCNRGLKASKGDWIKFIAGDDAIFYNTIEYYVNFIKTHKFCRVIHSNVKKYLDEFNENNLIEITNCSKLKINYPKTTPEEQFQILLRTGPIWASTTMIKKDVFDEVGFYDEQSAFWEDTPMWLKITKNGIKIHFLDFIGAKYRCHNASVQRSERNLQLFSSFKLSKDIYYKKNYLKELPFLEKLLRGFLITRDIYISKITKNRKSKLVILFIIVSGFSPGKILSKINEKYINF